MPIPTGVGSPAPSRRVDAPARRRGVAAIGRVGATSARMLLPGAALSLLTSPADIKTGRCNKVQACKALPEALL